MNKRGLADKSLWVLSVLVALAFILSGVPKIAAMSDWILKFADWGYSVWFMRLVGATEIACGLLLLVPRSAPWAAGLLGLVMLGAAYTHLARNEWSQFPRPLLFLLLLALIVRGRRKARAPGAAPLAERP